MNAVHREARERSARGGAKPPASRRSTEGAVGVEASREASRLPAGPPEMEDIHGLISDILSAG